MESFVVYSLGAVAFEEALGLAGEVIFFGAVVADEDSVGSLKAGVTFGGEA